MKNINKIVLSFLLQLALFGCKKAEFKTTPLVSFNITNAVTGGSSLTLNSGPNTISANSNGQFSLIAGQTGVNLSAATGATYYNQVVPTDNGDYYSLFLAGVSPSAVESVLIKENYTNYKDSLSGVRFINLLVGSAAVSVNLNGKPNGSETASLTYKGYSSFKTYAAKITNTSYVFEFRNATTGNLLTSYTLTPVPFGNVTVALTGTNAAPAVQLVKHYSSTK